MNYKNLLQYVRLVFVILCFISGGGMLPPRIAGSL